MSDIIQVLQKAVPSLSFELFPPKTDQGFEKLLGTIEKLAELSPDFISCTYGAGGGSRGKTFDIVQHIQDKHRIPSVAHLTCVCHTKDEILEILKDLQRRGVRHILALRGDPPQDRPDWQPGENNFRYSSELCAFVRKHFGQEFTVGVAGFPEGHPLSPDREADAKVLKEKVDRGADFVITQFFFRNADYFDYVERLRALGVTVPVLPGILPVTNYANLLKFCGMCQAVIPDEIKDLFEPIRNDPEKTLEAGTHFAVKQARELLDGGAPGLHFFALNKVHPVKEIIGQLDLTR